MNVTEWADTYGIHHQRILWSSFRNWPEWDLFLFVQKTQPNTPLLEISFPTKIRECFFNFLGLALISNASRNGRLVETAYI